MKTLNKLGKEPEDVIADYLRELVKYMGAHVEHSDLKEELNPYHVRWCVTVPAMWSDAAKQKMQRAMFKASLIPSLNSQRVVFCSEPMAGLLSEALSIDTRTRIQPDDAILVIDLGGGTADLSAMRMGSDGFTELVPGLGASCGSTMLDDEFIAMFKRAVGPAVYDQVVAKFPNALLAILRDWEECKTSFSGEDRFFGCISIPRTMDRLRDEDCGSDEVDVDEGEICITPVVMQQLYRPIVDQIVKLGVQMYEQCTAKDIDVDHVLCIGGFSQSKYLINTLRKRLPFGAMKLVASPNGSAAVLLGAPIFACRPELIRKQVAQCTYGVGSCDIHAPSQYGPRDKLMDRFFMSEDDLPMVEKCFSVLIRKGENLVPGQVFEKTYVPIRRSQTSGNIRVFVSHLEDPIYTDTVGCDEVGTVKINVKPVSIFEDVGSLLAKLRVLPSGLVLDVTNKRTGEKVDMTLDFYD
ncbi:hypothetical protein AMAG_12924 [Allomyces macrogynus ATCC 38327]|uniref:Hsp70-like protein n=1 Tax=Allomyces macrogynus (strain ATCC 38327) TaxID=578462 RepID=A0A0L0T0S2_ALLM3|nr:hypothetical protein AMAG_12924 [Allomyces macrogynus ATCC 38327]|eukprot:KNE68250.1 hypothetical protein AMAG_12924 [Allomyces macrogynus ATCC 38327]